MNKVKIIFSVVLLILLTSCEKYGSNLDHRNTNDPNSPLIEGKARAYGILKLNGQILSDTYVDLFLLSGANWSFYKRLTINNDGSYIINLDPGMYGIGDRGIYIFEVK